MSVTEQNNLFYKILTERWVLCWGRNWYVQNCWLRKVQAGISENKFSRICRLMGRSRYCLCCCSCFLPCTGSWLNRVSDVWVRNCHLVLQQDKGNLWTLKGLWVFEDCGLPAVEVSICSLGVLWWAAPGTMWVNHRSWASSHPMVTLPFLSASLQLHRKENCQEWQFSP